MNTEEFMRRGTVIEHRDKTVGDSGYSHEGYYFFVKECRMKLPSGEWIDAVVYDNIRTKETYVREKNDFYKKFKAYGE